MSRYEERIEQFEISLLNEPISEVCRQAYSAPEMVIEPPPLTARQIADRRWHMDRNREEKGE